MFLFDGQSAKCGISGIILGMMTLGIDEVGRGCWAGPLVVAGVMLDDSADRYHDSKSMSAQRRRLFAKNIQQQHDVAMAWIEPCVIDEVGIADSMRRGVAHVLSTLLGDSAGDNQTRIVLDGIVNYAPANYAVETLPRADAQVSAVAAASIVAKVARDQYMIDQAKQFPDYSFDAHVGYGTKAHRAALERYGMTPLHRLSFQPMKTLLAAAEGDEGWYGQHV